MNGINVDLEERKKQIDNLIWKLELATHKSADGTKSWDEFCKFLANFETLSKLHDPKETDVAKLAKRKTICYHIAGDQVDKNPQMAAEILPRIERLVQSAVFPNGADFFVLVDWLEQVTFLFELVQPEKDDLSKPLPVEALDQTLGILKALIGFCSNRLNCEIVHGTTINWRPFEQTCGIAKLGVSRESGLGTNLKAAELVEKIAYLLQDSLFVASPTTKNQYGLISGKLWSIVEEDLRCILMNNFTYNNKMIKNGHETRRALNERIVKLVELLPEDDDALEFFYTKLRKTSRAESDAADLTILDSILEARDHEAKGVWPILDIHMSRGDPIIREACLCMAIDRFGKESVDMDELKAMLKHLDLIVDYATCRQPDERSKDTQFKIIVLLYSITSCDDSTKDEIRILMSRILKAISVNYLVNAIDHPDMINVRGKYAYPANANLFRDAAMDKFEQIYQSGVKAEGSINDLGALYKMATTDGEQKTSYKRKYVDIVAAGRDGLAPEGCDEKMFSFLKKAETVAEDEDKTCLLPIAEMVYNRGNSSPA